MGGVLGMQIGGGGGGMGMQIEKREGDDSGVEDMGRRGAETKMEKGKDDNLGSDGNNNNNDGKEVGLNSEVGLPLFSLSINNRLMYEPPLQNRRSDDESKDGEIRHKEMMVRGYGNESERGDTMKESDIRINESEERRMSIQTTSTCSTLSSCEINNYNLTAEDSDGIRNDVNNALIDGVHLIIDEEKEENFSRRRGGDENKEEIDGREEDGEENEDELDVVGGWNM
jgi:hypothetical protein